MSIAPLSSGGLPVVDGLGSSTRRIDYQGSASIAIANGRDSLTGSTFSGDLAAGLAAALNDYTRVDPATGIRQLKAGMADFAATDIAAALNGAGFSADQANAAAKSLVDQFAAGEKDGLSATFAAAFNTQTTASQGGSFAYSIVGTLSATLSVDGTGKLSVALERHTLETQQASADSLHPYMDGGSAAPGLSQFGFAAFGTVDPTRHRLSDWQGNRIAANAALSETEALTQDIKSSAALIAVSPGTVTLLGTAGELAAASLTATHAASDVLSQAADGVDPNLKIALAGLKQAADRAAAQPADGTRQGAGYNDALASVLVQVKRNLGAAVADSAGYGSYGFARPDGAIQGFTLQPLGLSA